jgi:ceramide glucosyltransferase
MAGWPQFSLALTQRGGEQHFQFAYLLPWGALLAPALWLLRIGLAQNLQRRFTPERKLISPAWLVPVRDLLNAAIWLAAFLGNTIEWRGRKMKLRRDGTLVEL